MTESDFRGNELITVQLPRKDFQRLEKILAREEAMSWWVSTVQSWWFFAFAGGILSVWALWDKIKEAI